MASAPEHISNDIDVVFRALDAATKNGFRQPDPAVVYGRDNKLTREAYWLLFNHDFAKALWGAANCTKCKSLYYIPAHEPYDQPDNIAEWQYHLQQMVIAEDPIAYLAEHMP